MGAGEDAEDIVPIVVGGRRSQVDPERCYVRWVRMLPGIEEAESGRGRPLLTVQEMVGGRKLWCRVAVETEFLRAPLGVQWRDEKGADREAAYQRVPQRFCLPDFPDSASLQGRERRTHGRGAGEMRDLPGGDIADAEQIRRGGAE